MRQVIDGIVRNEKGEITAIDPSFEDPDDVGIDLTMLSLAEAKKLDEDLRDFFHKSGESQGSLAIEGDSGFGRIPWARGLFGGSKAWDLQQIVFGIDGMSGLYTGALWEGFENGLPDHLVVEGNEGDGTSWNVARILDYECPKCKGTLTTTDETIGYCRECKTTLGGVNYILTVLCDTTDCPKRGSVINTITGRMNARALDDFYESYGCGGEEEADHCPACGNLGVLMSPEVAHAPVQDGAEEVDERESHGGAQRDG